MKLKRLVAPVALLLAASPLLAACAGGMAQANPSDIIQQMRDTLKKTTSVQGAVDLSLTINKDGIRTLVQGMMPGTGDPAGDKDWASRLPDSASASLKYWRQSPDKMRVELLSATIPGAGGAILVYDGQKAYALDAARNVVYTATPSKHIDSLPDEMKAMMGSLDMEKEIDKLLSASDFKLVGTEKVAGSDAYRLDFTPKADAADLLGIPAQLKAQAGVLIKDLKASLWVDKDRSFPLKLTLEHPNIGSFTYSATALELNKSIDAATFVLQVPAGAKTVDLDEKAENMQPKQVTLPEARDYATKAGWALLEPGYVPGGATLVGVTQMAMPMGSVVTLSYSSKEADFTVMEMYAPGGMMGKGMGGEMPGPMMGLGDGFSGVDRTDGHKEVTVRGVQGRVFSPDGANWTSLMWQEKGSSLWVAVRGNFSLEEALKIAEGLK